MTWAYPAMRGMLLRNDYRPITGWPKVWLLLTRPRYSLLGLMAITTIVNLVSNWIRGWP